MSLNADVIRDLWDDYRPEVILIPPLGMIVALLATVAGNVVLFLQALSGPVNWALLGIAIFVAAWNAHTIRHLSIERRIRHLNHDHLLRRL